MSSPVILPAASYDTTATLVENRSLRSQRSLLRRDATPTPRPRPATHVTPAELESLEYIPVQEPERTYSYHDSANIGKPNTRSSIITVRPPRFSNAPRLRCSMSAMSDKSSGLTISQEAISEPLGAMLRDQPSETYKWVATDFSAITISDDESFDGAKAEKHPAYALEPLDCLHDVTTTAEHIDALIQKHPLPESKGRDSCNQLRYGFFSAYRRLHALILLINTAALLILIILTSIHQGWMTYENAVNAAGANLFIATICRHEHFINLLFFLATSLPRCTPLVIRRNAAKVYSYGGVHSACGVSAFLWYMFFAVLALYQFTDSTPLEQRALAGTTGAVLVMFILIIGLAHPTIRAKYHDQWEVTHRFGGWAAVGLVWAQTIIISTTAERRSHEALGLTLVKLPTFWFLVIITCCIIYPWLHLRRRRVEAEPLSSHAVRLYFPTKKPIPMCVATRLSDHPLTENHGFATIPNPDGEGGFSIVVSNGGDWTKKVINNPPDRIWTRGAFTTGVLKVALLFRPLVLVATGSGIGPCLSFLQVHPEWPVRIIWSARFPEATYGRNILKSVLRADKDAVIIDTKKSGHPDMVALAYALYRGVAAEAVVIISNPNVTRQVVYGMETRGVPAFGAIFDS